MNRIVIKSRNSPRERLCEALMKTYNASEDCCFYGIDQCPDQSIPKTAFYTLSMFDETEFKLILDHYELVRVDRNTLGGLGNPMLIPIIKSTFNGNVTIGNYP